MDVLQRFTAGDLDAFETLFRAYQNDVYRWLLRIVRDPAAAEDLTIETFWRIYRARAHFDPSREFGPWARRISTNASLDYLKVARRHAALITESRIIEIPAVEAAEPHELRDALAHAFARLPLKLRVAATLALIEGVPNEEIAEALHISVNGVKSRVFRAIRLLRKTLKKSGFEPCTNTTKTNFESC